MEETSEFVSEVRDQHGKVGNHNELIDVENSEQITGDEYLVKVEKLGELAESKIVDEVTEVKHSVELTEPQMCENTPCLDASIGTNLVVDNHVQPVELNLTSPIIVVSTTPETVSAADTTVSIPISSSPSLSGAKSPSTPKKSQQTSTRAFPLTPSRSTPKTSLSSTPSRQSKSNCPTPLKPPPPVFITATLPGTELPDGEPGSRSLPYRLAIIGGGPSGCSILVRAARIGVLDQLCSSTIHTPKSSRVSSKDDSQSKEKHSSTSSNCAGVCLIDASSMERLGGGRLQDYLINSNTWVSKFVTQVTEDKPENIPQEHGINSLSNIPVAQQLLTIGNKTGPLQVVGSFLRNVGQSVSSLIAPYKPSSQLIAESVVLAMQQVADPLTGDVNCWQLLVAPLQNIAKEDRHIYTAEYFQSLPAKLKSDFPIPGCKLIFARHVTLATGGHQEQPRFQCSSMVSKVLCSDDVCTEQGIRRIREMLEKAPSCNENAGRIAIIGGSHSAFSAAWMCLHKLDHVSSSTGVPSVSKGKVALNKLRVGPSGICILHRSPIKVFFATKQEAERDNYTESIIVNRVTGQLNPFGGLRGDAKELWRQIRQGRESRIRLLQVRGGLGLVGPCGNDSTEACLPPNGATGVKQSIIERVLEEAAVIIWACGYHSNLPVLLNPAGKLLPLAISKGQVNVDSQARVMSVEEVPIPYLYASGLGFGLRATLDNGDLDGSSGRADGVAVYLKRGATMVLGHVVGNVVFGGNVETWEERNALINGLKQQARLAERAKLAAETAESAPVPTLSIEPNNKKERLKLGAQRELSRSLPPRSTILSTASSSTTTSSTTTHSSSTSTSSPQRCLSSSSPSRSSAISPIRPKPSDTRTVLHLPRTDLG